MISPYHPHIITIPYFFMLSYYLLSRPIITVGFIGVDTISKLDQTTYHPIMHISSAYHHIIISLSSLSSSSNHHTITPVIRTTQVWLVLTPLAKLTKPHITSRGQAIHIFLTYLLFWQVIFVLRDVCFIQIMMRRVTVIMMIMAMLFAGNAIVMQSHKNSCHLLTNAFSKQAPQDPSPNWFQWGQ